MRGQGCFDMFKHFVLTAQLFLPLNNTYDFPEHHHLRPVLNNYSGYPVIDFY